MFFLSRMPRNTSDASCTTPSANFRRRFGSARNSWAGFFIAILLVVLAVLVTKALPFKESTTYVLLVFAVTLSAWYGGFSSGFLALVLATILSNFVLIPPPFSFSENDDLLRTLVFVTMSLIVSWWANIQKSARQALQEAESRFRLLMKNVIDYAILLLDYRGAIQDWNSGAVDLLGLDYGHRGKPLSTIFLPEGETSGAIADLPGPASPYGLPTEQWYVRADGTRFWGFTVLTPLRDDEGTLAGYVLILRDLTERKRLDEEREQLIKHLDQANKEREHFMAVLAHDLRGYATSVIGWSGLGRSGKLNTIPDCLQGFEAIDRAARQQIDLMEKMLDLAKFTTGNLQLVVSPFDVSTILNKAVDMVRSAAELKRVDVLQTFHSHTVIQGDPDRLLQALLNLLWNAVKYTPANGVVRVECAVNGSFVEIVVCDNGPGISAELLPELFEPFRCGVESGQTGTGLGLAIVRQIVDLHGGSVRADNLDQPKGSKFTITLPVGGPSARMVKCASDGGPTLF
jgi:PAS domain S-box-containing protein